MTPGGQLRVSPLYFFLKNLATFFSRQFCGVTPDSFFAETDDLFCSSLYRFLLLFTQKVFLPGVTPLEGVNRGGPPPPPSDATALFAMYEYYHSVTVGEYSKMP